MNGVFDAIESAISQEATRLRILAGLTHGFEIIIQQKLKMAMIIIR
jgi:hypothetical protein